MKSAQLALLAARKRQSQETGFVHYSYENPASRETIPLFENFCFVLSLFKTRLAEQLLEGKALLEKLLAFEVDGHFPVYLHEFPLCRDFKLSSKIYPVIFWLLKDFNTVLGEGLRGKLENLLSRLPKPSLTRDPLSPEEWADFLIWAQIEGTSLEPALEKWHPLLFSYLGHQKQEKFEPALTLYDIFLGELTGEFSVRALQDHPIHLRASLIQPANLFPRKNFLSNMYQLSDPFTLLWGGKEALHSLVLETKGKIETHLITLEEALIEDDIEIAFFVSARAVDKILVNHQKANTFQLGEPLEILSQDRKITLTLSLVSGEGKFFGHLFKANRTGQLSVKKDGFDSYDWKISLRTIKRLGPCQIRFTLEGLESP